MGATNIQKIDRVRSMAARLDCFVEEDFQLLALATESTIEAWRKRGKGPAYIRFGNRYLYPCKSVEKYLDSITKQRFGFDRGVQ